MVLEEILPKIWHKLIGRKPITSDKALARSARKLVEQMAERERKMDALERVGLGHHAVENLYPPPVDPRTTHTKENFFKA